MATSTTYLERTFAAGNRKKWTWSAWVKRANLGSNNWLFHTYVTGTNECSIFFTPDDQFAFSIYTGNNNNGRLTTNRKFRDTNSWYHLQCVWDTANSTAGDRMKMYVNGVEETSFATDTNPPLNYESIFNSGINHTIGQYGSNDASMRFSGSMSYINFSDGYALAPTVFGETDSTTGEWKINTSPSFTLGTNGFTILKDGNTITDQSSNSNNWSASGTLTKTEDCPSNVFATLNPLDNQNQGSTLTVGNNKIEWNTDNKNNFTTLAMNAGKYYWEMKYVITTGGQNAMIGVSKLDTRQGDSYAGHDGNSWSYYSNNGQKYHNGSGTSYGNSWGTDNIIGVAFDTNTRTIWFSKDGVWQNSATISEIAAGTTTNSAYTGIGTAGEFFIPCMSGYDGNKAAFNFGNGYFSTTAVSSAGTNASGNGIFEYDVPTGFTALSTKGLNL